MGTRPSMIVLIMRIYEKVRRHSLNYHTAILSDDVITIHIVSYIIGFSDDLTGPA